MKSFVAAYTDAGHEVDETSLKKTTTKMRINLLIEEGAKLDWNKRSDSMRLQQICDKVVNLIIATYGENVDKSKPRNTLRIDDYVALSRDYFDVTEDLARKMFKKVDTNGDGTLDLAELRSSLEPIFRSSTALVQLRFNGLKASNAGSVTLFASPSLISKEDVVGMAYLAAELGTFVKGNIILTCCSSTIFLNAFFGVFEPAGLGLLCFSIMSVISIWYSLVFWRYFRTDWWSMAGIWINTAGTVIFARNYGQVYDALHEESQGSSPNVLSDDKAASIGFFLFTVASIPFTLAREVDPDGESCRKVHYRYDHNNCAARAGAVFFLGSALFLFELNCHSVLTEHQDDTIVSFGYALYLWGRAEGLFGAVFNTRKIAENLAAAAIWSHLTTGAQVRKPNRRERLTYLLCGKRSDRLLYYTDKKDL